VVGNAPFRVSRVPPVTGASRGARLSKRHWSRTTGSGTGVVVGGVEPPPGLVGVVAAGCVVAGPEGDVVVVVRGGDVGVGAPGGAVVAGVLGPERESGSVVVTDPRDDAAGVVVVLRATGTVVAEPPPPLLVGPVDGGEVGTGPVLDEVVVGGAWSGANVVVLMGVGPDGSLTVTYMACVPPIE
jgi:hypothetical protein